MEDRELDAAVAEKVMGWRESIDYDYHPPQINWANESGEFQHVRDDPRNPENVNSLAGWTPSTDISAAFEVVERFIADGYDVSLRCHVIYGRPSRWRADLFRAHDDGPNECEMVVADTLPRAICEASLAALSAIETK
jgi:hypothetical protein